MLLAIALSTVPARAVQGGEIRIWPHGQVTGETIKLRDVAELRGFDWAESQRLGELVVHGAPRNGGTLLVHAGDLRGALDEADVNLADVRIFGSSRCKVSRTRTPKEHSPPSAATSPKPPRRRPPRRLPKDRGDQSEPAPDSLESALRRHIAARLADDDAKLEVRFSPTARRALTLSGPQYRFIIHPPETRKLGLLGFEVDVQEAGKSDRTVAVAAEVLLVKEVVVARRPINQGQIISGRDVKLQERRFTKVDGVGVTSLSSVIGLQSQRFLKQGTMLEVRSLRAEPLVRRGQYVKILIRGEGVEIRTTGKSQQAGALGDVITVRRDGSRRQQDLIEAMVSGPGLVTYHGPRHVARWCKEYCGCV